MFRYSFVRLSSVICFDGGWGTNKYVCKMEQYVFSGASANAAGQGIPGEIAGLEIKHLPGCLRAEIYIREGIESMLSVYSITGQLKFRKRIVSSGSHEFSVDLKKGAYVATLISGKNWAARRVTVR